MSEADVNIPGYRLLSRLSAGGMAAVYVGEQLRLNARRVAIKVFRGHNPDHTRDRQKRFEQEALFARSLQHPHIVQIYDYGSTDSFQFLVMEYLEHGDLKQRIRAGLDARQALLLLRQIASALQQLHDQGIVHRDIKPANILFRAPDHAVLADFGIARAVDQNTQLTQTGFVLGTPSYMSPEQINGSNIGTRSDIYALGVVFYEMLTGQQPYRGESVQSVATQHLMAPVPQLPLPVRKLQPLLNKMMAKKPADRIANAGALLPLLDAIDTTRSLGVKPPSFVQRHARKLATISGLFAGAVAVTWYGVNTLPQWLDDLSPHSATVMEEPLPVAVVTPVRQERVPPPAVSSRAQAPVVVAPATAPVAVQNTSRVAAAATPVAAVNSVASKAPPAPSRQPNQPAAPPPRREQKTQPVVATGNPRPPAAVIPDTAALPSAPAMALAAAPASSPAPTTDAAPPPVADEKPEVETPAEKPRVRKPPPVISYF